MLFSQKAEVTGFGCSVPSSTSHMHLYVSAKSLHSCPSRYDSFDCSPQGSSVHGTLQARILECPPPEDLPDRGSNPCLLCLLHWQAGSLPLAPPGKPQGPLSLGQKPTWPVSMAGRALWSWWTFTMSAQALRAADVTLRDQEGKVRQTPSCLGTLQGQRQKK